MDCTFQTAKWHFFRKWVDREKSRALSQREVGRCIECPQTKADCTRARPSLFASSREKIAIQYIVACNFRSLVSQCAFCSFEVKKNGRMKLLCFLSLLSLAFNSMSKTFHSHLSIRVHRVHENALIDREVVIVITAHVCRCGGGVR